MSDENEKIIMEAFNKTEFEGSILLDKEKFFQSLTEKQNSSPSLKKKIKDKRELKREFEDEEWSNLLSKMQSNGLTKIDDVDLIYEQETFIDVYWNNGFHRVNAVDFIKKQKSFLFHILRTKVKNIKKVIEYGSGFGSKIIFLATEMCDMGLTFASFDLSVSGLDIQKILVANKDIEIEFECVDYDPNFVMLETSLKDSLIFTFQSFHYWPSIPQDLFVSFQRKGVKRMCLFEPLFEYQDQGEKHFRAKRDYIDLNDYNKDLLMTVRNEHEVGVIKRLEISRPLFGKNPLLPVHLIEIEF